MSGGGVTAWVTAEQLSHDNPALSGASRVLMIESRAAMSRRRFHRRKLHLVLTAMRRFADELRDRGVEVDYRAAPTFGRGIAEHRARHSPGRIVVLAPTGDAARASYEAISGVGILDGPNPAFLLAPGEFAQWAEGRSRLRMGDFYRHQRRAFGVLMENGRPIGGAWSYDTQNREGPPADRRPPPAWAPREDDIDRRVRDDLNALGVPTFGEDGPRAFPATRDEALDLLGRFVAERLPDFGRWQDAMLRGERSMWHSLLAPALNLGLLAPWECIAAAERSLRDKTAPLAAVEGFVRQILGWREFVRGLYEVERWTGRNALGARSPLPALFWGGPTGMRCLADALEGVRREGYGHHIERLMLFGNLMLLAGVHPEEAFDWFHASFLDGHEWVMAPNVYGMALHADGGVMASKPYAATGRYVERMSDHCTGCRYRPGARTGDRACPFTVLYWDFLDRKRPRFGDHPRMALMFRHLDSIPPDEMREIRARALALRRGFDA